MWDDTPESITQSEDGDGGVRETIRPEHFSGRAEKKFCYFGSKKFCP
jgi:hypothetical protein